MSDLQDLYEAAKDAIEGLAETTPDSDVSTDNNFEAEAEAPNQEQSWSEQYDSYPRYVQRAIVKVVSTAVMLALIWLVSQWWSAALFAVIGLCCMIGLPVFFYVRTAFFSKKEQHHE